VQTTAAFQQRAWATKMVGTVGSEDMWISGIRRGRGSPMWPKYQLKLLVFVLILDLHCG
jgi:hypothetical protein